MKIAIALAFAALTVLLWNRFWPFDPDAGGYIPSWRNTATYPKMFVHGITAYAIVATMLRIGVKPIYVVVIMVPAIFGYEWSQRFTNRFDILAGIAGLVTAVLVFFYFPGA